ncbi:MAG: hypothetical protein HY271_07695 [Deltaproteobacteria bacterium]|nr:hypothetical protein [Deltaproteobacteria bacterium]
MHDTEPRATFTAMEGSTSEDWAKIGSSFVPFAQKLPGSDESLNPDPRQLTAIVDDDVGAGGMNSQASVDRDADSLIRDA